jgi:hypothetical protein
VLAIAWLPWHAAARAWTWLSLAALIWLAWTLAALRRPDRPPAAASFALILVALALWPPVLHCLEKGQWSIWLAALLASGYRALERGRPGRAGALFGVAASVKATPVVVLVLLLARRRRAAAVMLATMLAIALVATAVDGVAPWRAFVADAPRDVAAWATWLANTASLQGVYARLFTDSPFTRPLVHAPGLSRGAFLVTSLALVAAAAIVGWRRGAVVGLGDGSRLDDRAAARWSAAWLTLPVLLNPLGWTHVVVMLLAPLVVALRDGGPRARAAAVASFAVLSIPRQRLMAWAGPMPVMPTSALVLGVHAVAAVILYVALLADEDAIAPA